jgi:hypothetical protein
LIQNICITANVKGSADTGIAKADSAEITESRMDRQGVLDSNYRLAAYSSGI